jgi:hypothetical protein
MKEAITEAEAAFDNTFDPFDLFIGYDLQINNERTLSMCSPLPI